MLLARTMRDAQEMYYLANGEYAQNWEEIGTDFMPAGGTVSADKKRLSYPDGMNCFINQSDSALVDSVKSGVGHAMAFQKGNRSDIDRHSWCGRRYDDPVFSEEAQALCKSLTGKTRMEQGVYYFN